MKLMLWVIGFLVFNILYITILFIWYHFDSGFTVPITFSAVIYWIIIIVMLRRVKK